MFLCVCSQGKIPNLISYKGRHHITVLHGHRNGTSIHAELIYVFFRSNELKIWHKQDIFCVVPGYKFHTKKTKQNTGRCWVLTAFLTKIKLSIKRQEDCIKSRFLIMINHVPYILHICDCLFSRNAIHMNMESSWPHSCHINNSAHLTSHYMLINGDKYV